MKQILYFSLLLLSIATPLSAIETGEYTFKLSVVGGAQELDIHVKSGNKKIVATMIDSRGMPATLEGVISGNQIFLWSRSNFVESKEVIEVHQMVGTIDGGSAKGNGCLVKNTKVQEYRWEFIPK